MSLEFPRSNVPKFQLAKWQTMRHRMCFDRLSANVSEWSDLLRATECCVSIYETCCYFRQQQCNNTLNEGEYERLNEWKACANSRRWYIQSNDNRKALRILLSCWVHFFNVCLLTLSLSLFLSPPLSRQRNLFPSLLISSLMHIVFLHPNHFRFGRNHSAVKYVNSNYDSQMHITIC